jgi:hypothetical protein
LPIWLPEQPLDVDPRNYEGMLHLALSDALPVHGADFETYSAHLYYYEQTEWGRHHMTQPPRYSQSFGYDPDQMLQDLGEDIDPIIHNQRVHNDITAITARQVLAQVHGGEILLTSEDIVAGRFAAMTHDIPECTHPEIARACGGVIGDIEYGQKTTADERLERDILAYQYGVLFPKLPTWLRERSIAIVRHEENSHVRWLSEAVHDLGAFSTAFTAGRVAVSLLTSGQAELPENQIRYTQLRNLAVTVGPRMLSKAITAAAQFDILRPTVETSIPDYEMIQEELATAA